MVDTTMQGNPVLQPDPVLWPAALRSLTSGSEQGPSSFRAAIESPKNCVVRAHVWATRLNLKSAALSALAATLSSPERERAALFRSDLHRNRFIAGRGFLRAVLGGYLRIEPSAVPFDYGPQGKPVLAGRLAESGLHFNLAHSEDLALLAVTTAGMIGIDVERVRPLADAEALVARFFSRRESAAFRKLPADEQPEAFFNLWTRKEAWLKATGEGIAHSLQKVEVSFLPGEPARALCLPEGWDSDGSWSLHHLEPALHFVGAVAIGHDKPQLVCRHWNFDQPIPQLLRDSLTPSL